MRILNSAATPTEHFASDVCSCLVLDVGVCHGATSDEGE